jgi:demethylmenaquinone methyltransferase / 2-methoxy-6-polyprenyl-1,4-benzoquinol methylase
MAKKDSLEIAEDVDFGFKTVDKAEKPSRVQKVFTEVSQKYDLMNDLMSLGMHRLWKRKFIKEALKHKPTSIIDMASGTGDIGLGFYRALNGAVQLTLCDPNPDMLKQAQDQAINRGITKNIEWVISPAEDIPLKDKQYDLYTISFGLRNTTDLDQALSEAWRVLKPGGYFYCLEFSKVFVPGLRKIYQEYSFNLIPKIGKLVSKNEDAYRYLVESIERFPDQESLAGRMRACGFEKVNFMNLSGGIVAIHYGMRPLNEYN